jgi:hypothetical protein
MIKRLGFSFHGFFGGLGIADAVEISIAERKQKRKKKQKTKHRTLRGQGREIEG